VPVRSGVVVEAPDGAHKSQCGAVPEAVPVAAVALDAAADPAEDAAPVVAVKPAALGAAVAAAVGAAVDPVGVVVAVVPVAVVPVAATPVAAPDVVETAAVVLVGTLTAPEDPVVRLVPATGAVVVVCATAAVASATSSNGAICKRTRMMASDPNPMVHCGLSGREGVGHPQARRRGIGPPHSLAAPRGSGQDRVMNRLPDDLPASRCPSLSRPP
jgi:hypothetical protein